MADEISQRQRLDLERRTGDRFWTESEIEPGEAGKMYAILDRQKKEKARVKSIDSLYSVLKDCCPAFGPKPVVPEETIERVFLNMAHDFKMGLELKFDEFKKGYMEELEHGCRNPKTNITCDIPELTGRIVMAHLKEEPDYYTRHEVG